MYVKCSLVDCDEHNNNFRRKNSRKNLHDNVSPRYLDSRKNLQGKLAPYLRDHEGDTIPAKSEKAGAAKWAWDNEDKDDRKGVDKVRKWLAGLIVEQINAGNAALQKQLDNPITEEEEGEEGEA